MSETMGVADEAPPPVDEPAAAARLRRLDELIGTGEVVVVGASLAMLIVTAVAQVFLDKVLDSRPTWPYEVIRNGVFFVATSGAALAAQRKGMFNMDLVTRKFSPRFRSYLRIATAALVAFLCVMVIRSAIELRGNTFALKEAHEIFSAAHAYLALIVAAGLIAFHFILHAVIEVTFLAAGKIPPDPPHGGH